MRSTHIFISITLIGTTSKEPLLRSTANVGDVIAVTGYLGGSAGGLRLIQQSVNVSQASQDYLLTAHRMPTPQVESGRVLVDCDIRTAMDISDGLADDLSKLCLASHIVNVCSPNLLIDTLTFFWSMLLTSDSRKFICPIKSPTNKFFGLLYKSFGGEICKICPLFITATLSDIVIASS